MIMPHLGSFQSFEIMLSPALSMQDMLDRGNYQGVSSGLLASTIGVFDGEGKRRVSLVPLGKTCTGEEAIAALKEMGYKSLALQALLVVGMTHPQEQMTAPIAALGWKGFYTIEEDGEKHVHPAYPCLAADGNSHRAVNLHDVNHVWGPNVRFLVEEI